MKNKAISKGILIATAFFLIPPFFIKIFGENEWVGRLIATFIFLWIIIPIFAFWLLNPKSDVIGKEAKLNQPRFKKAKTIFNIGFRSVLLLCIAIMLWTYMLPFLYGTYTVFKGGELMRIKGTVSCVTVPFPLLDVFTQEIVLKENDKKNSYRFWYPLRLNLPENRTYELLVLPKSNLVLEARELPGEK